MEDKKIAFIGAGNMVKAIVSGLVSGGYNAAYITATAPSDTRRLLLEQEFSINTTSDNISAAKQADVVILAVKPQMMQEVCATLQSVDWSDKLVISIAAGVGCQRLCEMLDHNLNIIKEMVKNGLINMANQTYKNHVVNTNKKDTKLTAKELISKYKTIK